MKVPPLHDYNNDWSVMVSGDGGSKKITAIIIAVRVDIRHITKSMINFKNRSGVFYIYSFSLCLFVAVIMYT